MTANKTRRASFFMYDITTPSMLECKYSCSIFFIFIVCDENSSPNLGEEFAASLQKLIGTRVIFHSFILSCQKFHVVGNAGDVLLRVGQSGVQLSLGYLPCNLWCETLCATSSASEHSSSLSATLERIRKLLWKL
ncbi:hypothetical protein CEXT_727661 [Caerostris extrusa]|uniref:Uncharacterized protein n=1 Tax=Caerostris extrusa TaxID=172846 RepID=A0AAV4TMD3_CAEEX|nr:hypothetical protein CEXT_727661 [Caerostris extrusa]